MNNTIKENVKTILAESETSRNSDASLVANYWYKYDSDYLYDADIINKQTVALPLVNYERVTSSSVIERFRRLIQEEVVMSGDIEEMKKYLPTDPKVIKMRRIRSVLWKNYINGLKIERVLNL